MARREQTSESNLLLRKSSRARTQVRSPSFSYSDMIAKGLVAILSAALPWFVQICGHLTPANFTLSPNRGSSLQCEGRKHGFIGSEVVSAAPHTGRDRGSFIGCDSRKRDLIGSEIVSAA
jgi:hypothetical protein